MLGTKEQTQAAFQQEPFKVTVLEGGTMSNFLQIVSREQRSIDG